MYTLSWRDIGYYYHSCILHRKRENKATQKCVCCWLPRRRTWDRSHTRRPTRAMPSRDQDHWERAERDTLSLSRLLLQPTQKNLFSTHLTDKMATQHLSLCSSVDAAAGAQPWIFSPLIPSIHWMYSRRSVCVCIEERERELSSLRADTVMTLSCFPYIGSVMCWFSPLLIFDARATKRRHSSVNRPTDLTFYLPFDALTSSCIDIHTQRGIHRSHWHDRRAESLDRITETEARENNIMDELVMMRSIGVGSSSGGNSMITSVRSLPEKPRRTGKKLCWNLFLCF